MTIKSYFYNEIRDIGRTAIKTQQGAISLMGILNIEELNQKFQELINQGKVSRYQLEDKLEKEEDLVKKTITISFPITLIFWTLFYFTYQPGIHSFIKQIAFLLIFLPVFFSVYYLMKSRDT